MVDQQPATATRSAIPQAARWPRLQRAELVRFRTLNIRAEGYLCMVEPYPRAYNDSMWIDIFYSAHKQMRSVWESAPESGLRGHIQPPNLLPRIAGEPQRAVAIADAVAAHAMPLPHHRVGGRIDPGDGKLEDRGPHCIRAEGNLPAEPRNAGRNRRNQLAGCGVHAR